LESTALHVTSVDPSGKLDPDVCVHDSEEILTLSVAVASANEAMPLIVPIAVLTVCDAGHVITGFSSSITVTAKLHDALFLDASSVVHTTDVTPAGKSKVYPASANAPTEQVAAEVATLSLTEGAANVIVRLPRVGVVVLTIFSGQLIVGFSASRTKSKKLHVAGLLDESVAVHDIVAGTSSDTG
jgi:hypothetical protein